MATEQTSQRRELTDEERAAKIKALLNSEPLPMFLERLTAVEVGGHSVPIRQDLTLFG